MDQAEAAINAATSNTGSARRQLVTLFSQERAAARRAYDAHEQRMKPYFDEAKEVQQKLLSIRQQLQADADNEIQEKVFDAGAMAYDSEVNTILTDHRADRDRLLVEAANAVDRELSSREDQARNEVDLCG